MIGTDAATAYLLSAQLRAMGCCRRIHRTLRFPIFIVSSLGSTPVPQIPRQQHENEDALLARLLGLNSVE